MNKILLLVNCLLTMYLAALLGSSYAEIYEKDKLLKNKTVESEQCFQNKKQDFLIKDF